MGSQLTLVDAPSPAPADESIVLTFDRDDMTNTTLRALGTYLPSYSVHTANNITTVYAGDGLLATITRRRFRRDQITFPGLKPMNLGSWLKAPTLSSFPLVFRVCGRRLEWQEDLSGRLVLREPSRPRVTLAWFSKSRRDLGDYLIHAAHLTIKPEIDYMKDMVVLSCLLAEHKIRVLVAQQGITMLDTLAAF